MTRLREGRLLAGAIVLSLLGVQSSLADTGEKAASFVAALDALRKEARIPGVSVAVVEDGNVVMARGLGLADIETGVAATERTPYNIASVSKPISAVAVFRLVEQGQIDLDRPIAAYSDWEEFCAAFAKQPSIFARDLRCEPTVHSLRHLLSHTATGVPGRLFSYNPVLFSWASRPVMAATDTPFSELVTRLVLKPAGMNRSARQYRALELPEALAKELAPPHRVDDSGAVVRAPALKPQGDGAAGGIVSTVEDLAKFDIALDSGLLVSEESRAQMMSPTMSSQEEPLPYGVGWYVQDYRGMRLVWHSGWWEEAYSALYLKIPEKRLTLILLANSEGLWWGNPLDDARVEESPFVQAFLRTWLGTTHPAGE